jgi:hypothetical protein
MTSIETILLVGFMIVVGFLPSVLIAVIGWKLTRKVKNSFVRIIVRAAGFTALLNHIYAGPMFAVWVISSAPALSILGYYQSVSFNTATFACRNVRREGDNNG